MLYGRVHPAAYTVHRTPYSIRHDMLHIIMIMKIRSIHTYRRPHRGSDTLMWSDTLPYTYSIERYNRQHSGTYNETTAATLVMLQQYIMNWWLFDNDGLPLRSLRPATPTNPRVATAAYCTKAENIRHPQGSRPRPANWGLTGTDRYLTTILTYTTEI